MMEQITNFVQSYIQRNLSLIIVILAVLLVRLFMKKMPKKYVYCLWTIVGIRMLFSLQIASPVSIYQFFPWAEAREESSIVEVMPEHEGQDFAQVTEALVAESAAGEETTVRETAETWENAPSERYETRSGEELLGTNEDLQWSEPSQPWDQTNQRESLVEDPTGSAERLEAVIEENDASFEAETLKAEETTGVPMIASDNGRDAVSNNLVEQTNENILRSHGFVIMFFVLWMAGVLTVLGIGMISYVRVQRLVRKAVLVEGNLWECDGIVTPFVLGIFRPRIYVPFHLEEAQRNMVLAHERQHVRHLDPFARLFAYVLLAMYWMNPLVWVSYLCFVRDQEMRCDEEVISRLGAGGKKDYGMTLLAFATDERFVGFSPVAFGESDAEKRIKNVLNYKKPSFWIIVAGIAIVVCLGIVCLTTAKKKPDLGQEPEGQSEEGTPAGTEEMTNEETYHLTISADLDGDGVTENVNVTDYARGKTTLNVTMAGKTLKEMELKSVDMIQTKGCAADLTGDGREELILLQSSPILASTHNWPGKVTILRVEDGEWRQLSDELIYPETGEYAWQKYYPKKITDQICIGVQIETMADGKRMHLLYGLSYEAAHGMDGVLRLDCTYQAQPKEGWQVQYVFMGHDYVTNASSLQSRYHELYGISLGEEPEETIALEESLANKLFYSVPLQYFEGIAEVEGLGCSLSVSENGSFIGTDVKSGAGLAQTEICEFTGRFTNARRVNGKLYLLTVDGLTYPEENISYKQGNDQYVTMKPTAMAEGDQFLLYMPGYPVAELPYKVIRALEDQGMPSWYNYALEELPCYALLNLDQGTIYLSYYLDEYIGQRMETIGLYGDLYYPSGSDGYSSFLNVTRLCADACGLFVQKVTYPMSASKSFSELVRNEQLAEYLEYKTKHFLHRFSEGGSWRMETKTWNYVTVDGARVLHVTCIPKYKNGSAKGSWGTIHFLIDAKDGQLYIRDWYWDNPDSLDLAWRGTYSAQEGYDFWNHPVNYEEMLKKDARLADLSEVVFGLPVTCEEKVSDPENHVYYERKYYYKDVLVGKSSGYGECRDYVDDLDGDGITELICYTREMKEGDYDEVTVFRRVGNSIYMGRLIEYGSLNLTNEDTLSSTRKITHHYDPDEHCLYLTYPVKGGDYNAVPFTYDDMRFTEYSYVTPQANSWKEIYANYVRRSEYQEYALIYLDDDDIPELFCQDGNYPRRILSLQDGKINERYLDRNTFLYLEKKGIYYTEGGNMGYFPMEVIQLKDGEFTVLGSGLQKHEYIANAESTAPDQMSLFITYEWNGQSVTEEECNQKIDAIIERRTAVRPSTLYTADEILTLLGMEIISLAVG